MKWARTSIPRDHVQAYATGLEDFVDPGSPLWSLLRNNYEAYAVYNLVLNNVGYGNVPIKIEDPRENPGRVELALTYEKETGDAPNEKKASLKTLVKPTGWRFLASDSVQSGAVHVGSVQGPPPKVTGFSSEALISDAINCIREIESKIGRAAGVFELRILRVPWLHFEAFWLRSVDANDDLLVPYTGFPQAANLELMAPYSVQAFLTPIWPLTAPLRVQAAQKTARTAQFKAVFIDAASKAAESEALRLKTQAEHALKHAAALEAGLLNPSD